jgi:hypothetical protein
MKIGENAKSLREPLANLQMRGGALRNAERDNDHNR